MKQILLVLFACMLGCAIAKQQSEPQLPASPRDQLLAEIARIEPLLTWKDGWPCAAQARFFIFEDERRAELPTICEFIFCRNRFESIKKNMELQSGISIPTIGV